jgi:hypothetical protein
MGVTERSKLSRREMVEKLLGGMVAGASWPLLASSHPIHQHLKNGFLLDRADELAQTHNWEPLFLNAEQNGTLVALSEIIVPGSTKARVSQFIDLLLSVDTAEHQQKFVASLSAIENEGQKRFGKAFSALTVEEQETLVTGVSQAEVRRKHFDNLKEWIAGAYYSSEEGMRELGWNGTYAFESYPGCAHGDGSH